MMEVEELTAAAQIYSVLQRKKSTNNLAWTEADMRFYDIVIRELDDPTIFALITELAKNTLCRPDAQWRPDPTELLEMAAQLASPVPDENIVYNLICNTIAFGTGYDDVPEIVLNTVQALGGWEELAYRTDLNFLRAKVINAYKIEVIRWQKVVKEQLSLPAANRDVKYFPARETKTSLRLEEVA